LQKNRRSTPDLAGAAAFESVYDHRALPLPTTGITFRGGSLRRGRHDVDGL
jgi:hypothetical protein